MLAAPDQQISLTDPDARSMATSGRGSGVVGYNVQVAVDTEHHLIVTHEVTNVGTDRSQLAQVAKATKATLEVEKLDAIADRGYFNSEEILACEEGGITVTLPKPMTSNSRRKGALASRTSATWLRMTFTFVLLVRSSPTTTPTRKMDWSYAATDQRLPELRHQAQLHDWQGATDHPMEHEHILEAVQRRLDQHPEKMRQRRETVEHPFGTIKARMGATHFLMKTLPRVAAEMALHVLAYNLTRVMNIMGVQPLMAAIRA